MLFQFSECDWHGIWKQHSAQPVRRGSSYFRLQKKPLITESLICPLEKKKKIYSSITKIGFRMKNWGLTWTSGLFIFGDKFVKRTLRSVLEALDGSGSLTKKIAVLLGLRPAPLSRGSQEWRQLYLRGEIRLRLRMAFCAQNPRFPVQRILIRLFIILHLL